MCGCFWQFFNKIYIFPTFFSHELLPHSLEGDTHIHIHIRVTTMTGTYELINFQALQPAPPSPPLETAAGC